MSVEMGEEYILLKWGKQKRDKTVSVSAKDLWQKNAYKESRNGLEFEYNLLLKFQAQRPHHM